MSPSATSSSPPCLRRCFRKPLPVRRTDFGRQQVSRYAPLDDLWTSHHDGLIVTGTEPQAADLKDEPFWGSLTRVLEWAAKFEVQVHRLYVRPMCNKWASCSTAGTLSFNDELLGMERVGRGDQQLRAEPV